MFEFESFDRRQIPAQTRPIATLQRKGLLSLNQAAILALSEPEALELLYDPKARVVGLKPMPISENKAYPVRQQRGTHSYMVSLTRLCNYYGIDTSTALRYAPTMMDGVLVIELDKSIGDATGPRAGMKRVSAKQHAAG